MFLCVFQIIVVLFTFSRSVCSSRYVRGMTRHTHSSTFHHEYSTLELRNKLPFHLKRHNSINLQSNKIILFVPWNNETLYLQKERIYITHASSTEIRRAAFRNSICIPSVFARARTQGFGNYVYLYIYILQPFPPRLFASPAAAAYIYIYIRVPLYFQQRAAAAAAAHLNPLEASSLAGCAIPFVALSLFPSAARAHTAAQPSAAHARRAGALEAPGELMYSRSVRVCMMRSRLPLRACDFLYCAACIYMYYMLVLGGESTILEKGRRAFFLFLRSFGGWEYIYFFVYRCWWFLFGV